MTLVSAAYLLVIGGLGHICDTKSGWRLVLSTIPFILIGIHCYDLLFYWFGHGASLDTTKLTLWIAAALVLELGYRYDRLHQPAK